MYVIELKYFFGRGRITLKVISTATFNFLLLEDDIMEKTTAAPSIAEIEQQITKVQAALHRARAQQLLKAEKAIASAQKNATTAQSRINNIIAKGATTPAAQTRLTAAKAILDNCNQAVADAEQVLAAILKQQKLAAKIDKKTDKILAKGNKAKNPKKQKKLDKKARKAEKKLNASRTEQDLDSPAEVEPTPAAAAPVKAPARPRRKAPAKPKTAVIPEPLIEEPTPPALEEPEVEIEKVEKVEVEPEKVATESDKSFIDSPREAEPGVEQLAKDSEA